MENRDVSRYDLKVNITPKKVSVSRKGIPLLLRGILTPKGWGLFSTIKYAYTCERSGRSICFVLFSTHEVNYNIITKTDRGVGAGETTDVVEATLPVVEDEQVENQDLILTQTQSAPASDDQVQEVDAVETTGAGEETTLPDKPAGFESYVVMAITRKSTWIHNEDVIELMQSYLPNSMPSTWTMKRLRSFGNGREV